jgi:phosphoenolpyruvate phosphomutase
VTRSARFRQLLTSDRLEFACEAHNALSARIVEEAGFSAIWGSGLSISAALGVRDSNEASWTQILDVLEFMADATTVPILVDGDTGYGNFNNVRRLVRKLEQRGVAALCIEDKQFPKTNSLLDGVRQPLATIDEFAGKIKAAKDTQRDPCFSVVARVEALIAGWELGEALRRAEAYHEAGADAILIHSKSSRPDEILKFKEAWGTRCPVVIVPTKYFTTPTDVFRSAGFSLVIWANMILRSAVKAMAHTARRIADEQSLVNVDDDLVPIAEIFRLQGASELQEAESRYLPTAADTSALILAASRGHELGLLTEDRPKALLEIGGRPLLYRQADILGEAGIRRITVVRGYRKEMFDSSTFRYVDNDRYETTKEVASLALGLADVRGDVLVSYGDILYRKHIAGLLLESDGDVVLAVDSEWETSRNRGRYAELVECSQRYRRDRFNPIVEARAIGAQLPAERNCGEWIGLMKLSARALDVVRQVLGEWQADGRLDAARMADLLNELMQRGQAVRVQYVRGDWLDIDDLHDLEESGRFS